MVLCKTNADHQIEERWRGEICRKSKYTYIILTTLLEVFNRLESDVGGKLFAGFCDLGGQ